MMALQAQVTLSLDPCPLSGSGTVWEVAKVPGDLTHSGSSTIDLAWERTFTDLPDGWTNAICDPNLCYAPFADEPLGPGAVLETFPINPGETILGDNLYAQFQPNGIVGTGTIRLNIYEVADPSNSVLCEFSFSAIASSTDDPELVTVSLHPNPVRDRVRVMTSSNAPVRQVQLYNLVGKVVQTVDLGSSMNTFDLDLTTLQEGMYFARMFNASGELVASKRFNKLH
jgi:hypothetical protein